MAHVCSDNPTGERVQSPTVMEPDLDLNETTTAHNLLCSVQLFFICFYHYHCYFLLGLRVVKYYLSDKSKPYVYVLGIFG